MMHCALVFFRLIFYKHMFLDAEFDVVDDDGCGDICFRLDIVIQYFATSKTYTQNEWVGEWKRKRLWLSSVPIHL